MSRHAVRRTAPTYVPVAEIPHLLEALLPSDRIEQLAVETGFVQRTRKVEAVAMLWTLVLSFGVHLQRTLSAIKGEYEEWTDTDLVYSSWYGRFTPALAKFLKLCVRQAIEGMAQQAHRTLGKKLQRFDDLLIADSTIIRLHKALAKKWPAARSRKVAAGVKVSLLISAVANGPKTVALHGERTNELKTLRIGPWVNNRILLVDLGFFKYGMFARIAENGGSFVTRLKASANPTIVASHTLHRGCAVDVAGTSWKDIEDRLRRQVFDAEVEVSFSRRSYGGTRSGDTMRLRMVAIFDERTMAYHTYLTNIGPEVLSAEEVAELYGVRWEIELVFKELKGTYALDQVATTKAHIVEALIWTAILTMLVSRRLYSLLLASVPKELRPRYTPLRWAKAFVRTGESLLQGMLAHLGMGPPTERGFAHAAWRWERAALDPHVKRHRLTEQWYA